MNIKTQISRLLRKEQTKAEAKLWEYLRGRRFENLKFKRQHPIKEYIVDFINLEHGIIIELDGEYHNDILQKEKDQLRDIHLEALSYRVLRFQNKVVFEDLETILDSVGKNIKSSKSLPLPEGEGRGEGKFGDYPDPNLLPQRRRNSTILSTKKLTTAQKELLLNSAQMGTGIGFVEYNAIQIELLEIKVEEKIENAIFTSKNAVKAILSSAFRIQNCFCVGSNTKKLLEQNGQKVVEMEQNASDLAKIIVKKYKNDSFLFFCGNLRRDELPSFLNQNKIDLQEKIVYNTYMNPKKFNRAFDGILFFSPSAVQSYTAENEIGDCIAFCIGNTTASEARKHVDTVIIANKPTVENVIVQAVKYFK